MKNTLSDIPNTGDMDESFSNFQFLGIGKPSAKQTKRREKRKEHIDKLKDGISKDDFKEISHRWNKFNPAATIPRAAALLLVRLNFGGFARKMYPALLSEAELKAKHYNLANAVVVKKVWNNEVKKHWEALGGDMSSLEKATKQGFNKAIFKTKKVKAAHKAERGESFDGISSEIEGLSPYNRWANGFDLSIADSNLKGFSINEYFNEVDPTIISAAIGAGGAIVLAAINAKAQKAGAKDNPFDPKSSEYKNAENDPAEIPPALTQQDEEQLRAMAVAALEDRKKNGLDANTYEEEMDAIIKKYDKILGMPKPLFWTGVGVLTIGTTLLVLWKTGVIGKK